MVVDAVLVCERWGGAVPHAPQQPAVMQQGHHATCSPLAFQPQHSKPPSWMYLFETSIFKSWRCSVIKQNCFEENSSVASIWCKHGNVAVSVLMCAFDHTKQMLCSNEMAERLSWISWVAVYQGSVLLLSCHPMCGLTSRKQLLWVTVNTYLCNFSSLLSISCDLSRVMWAEGPGVEMEKDQSVCMYTMTLFHICSVWMWLLCAKGCCLVWAELVGRVQ